MIFVNDLASVNKIPAWMKHAPAGANAMTFVDVVFPAFLFIVGMAIPFAFRKRIRSGQSPGEIRKHIFVRTSGLLVLGILMVNTGGLDSGATGLNKHLWTLLMFIAAILVWNRYPQAEGNRKIFYQSLRITGILTLIVLAVIYRSDQGDTIGWLQTSWWGILGLIGWSYLTCSALYLLFRRSMGALIAALAFFVFLYIGDQSGALNFLNFIGDHLWLGGHIGGHASITTAGMITAMMLRDESNIKTLNEKIRAILLLALFLFIAGYLLQPLYGISKNQATPAWSLYCAAICCLLFLILFRVTDVKKITGWARFLHPAGSNPLLAYILPAIVYALLALGEITILSDYFGAGLTGVIRSLLFSLLILGLTNLLSRLHVRLHL